MGNLRHKLIVGRLEARSIRISVLRVPFHKGSTAKQESLNVFTGAFHRGGAVVGGISKACSSCGVLGHVHPYDIPESWIQNHISGGLLPQIHNREFNLSSCCLDGGFLWRICSDYISTLKDFILLLECSFFFTRNEWQGTMLDLSESQRSVPGSCWASPLSTELAVSSCCLA